MIDFGVMQGSMVEDIEVSAKFFPTGFLPSVVLYVETIPLALQMSSRWTGITAKTNHCTGKQWSNTTELHTIISLTIEKVASENFCSYSASPAGDF